MRMTKLVLFSSLLLAGIGCKSSNRNEQGSEVLGTDNSVIQSEGEYDPTVGVNNYYVAYANQGSGKLQFIQWNFKTNKPIKDLDGVTNKPMTAKDANNKDVPVIVNFGQSAGGLVIGPLPNRYKGQLDSNKDVNYGYYSGKLWACNDAFTFGTGKIVTTNSSDKCYVEFDTEDQSWYTLSIINKGPNGTDGLSYSPNAGLAAFTAAKTKSVPLNPATANPNGLILQPGDVNVEISAPDAATILKVMKDLESKFQTSSNQNQERNTCLKNGRANQWLDLQAHFYCILPYSPHRHCYSTSLVNETAGIDLIQGAVTKEVMAKVASGTLPKEKAAETIGAETRKRSVGTLIAAYNKSYNKCVGPKGNNPLPADQAQVFRYLMFTKLGLMDFKVESQNDGIDAFYKSLRPARERPRRVSDTMPYMKNQPRFDKIRGTQMCVIDPTQAICAAKK